MGMLDIPATIAAKDTTAPALGFSGCLRAFLLLFNLANVFEKLNLFLRDQNAFLILAMSGLVATNWKFCKFVTSFLG